MPDARLQRTRDAYRPDPAWRAPHVNAAAQLAARATRPDHPIRLSDFIGTDHWNTIEHGDH